VIETKAWIEGDPKKKSGKKNEQKPFKDRLSKNRKIRKLLKKENGQATFMLLLRRGKQQQGVSVKRRIVREERTCWG